MKYIYCPICSCKLSAKDDHGYSRLFCQKCGFVFYQNSKPTASTVLVNKDGKILLSKRSINPHFGKWDIVGGFLENGEDPKEGAKREAREEIGVDVKVGDLINICVDKYGDSEEDDFYTLNLFYNSQIISGEPKANDEISEVRWFSEDEIPWDQLAFENGKMALIAYFKSLEK